MSACTEPEDDRRAEARAAAVQQLAKDIDLLLKRSDELGLPFISIRLDEAAALSRAEGTGPAAR